MTERSLLAGDDEPAEIVGYGSVPAGTARDLLRRHTEVDDPAGQAWLRRVFTHPTTGGSSPCRPSPNPSRPPCACVVFRDRTCRTPWCDAPVRHADHARRRADGGEISAGNGQGLCEQCNYVKEAPGWAAAEHASSRPGHHVVETSTPTGHRYRSRPPPLPEHHPESLSLPRPEIEASRRFAEHLRDIDAA